MAAPLAKKAASSVMGSSQRQPRKAWRIASSSRRFCSALSHRESSEKDFLPTKGGRQKQTTERLKNQTRVRAKPMTANAGQKLERKSLISSMSVLTTDLPEFFPGYDQRICGPRQLSWHQNTLST